MSLMMCSLRHGVTFQYVSLFARLCSSRCRHSVTCTHPIESSNLAYIPHKGKFDFDGLNNFIYFAWADFAVTCVCYNIILTRVWLELVKSPEMTLCG